MSDIEKIAEKTPNQEAGRRGGRPEAIVIHCTGGKNDGVIDWIKDPNSQVSYHYLIRRDAAIVQFVREEDTAWHAGREKDSQWRTIEPGKTPNHITIGIAYTGDDELGPKVEQIATMAVLVAEVAKRWGIPLDKNHIIPHNLIAQDKTCPGLKMDLSALLYLAKLA